MGNITIERVKHPSVRFDNMMRAEKPHRSWKETSRVSQYRRRRAPLTHVDKYAGR